LEQATADSTYLDGQGGWSSATGYETMLRNALNTFGDEAAEEEAKAMDMPREAVGIYGAVSWWPGSMEQVSQWSGGSLADIAYASDPVSYINALTPIRGLGFLDTAISLMGDYELDLPSLAGDVFVPLTTLQLANIAGNLYLRDQSIYLSNDHIYGSSRLGLSQYVKHLVWRQSNQTGLWHLTAILPSQPTATVAQLPAS
jgi:hypothetical protein